MNTSKYLNYILTTIVLLTFSQSSYSQELEVSKGLTTRTHTISSKITGHDYELELSFPERYSLNDTVSYPVLYVINSLGLSDFKEAQKKLGSEGEVEDVIIVGIGFENTTSYDSSVKRYHYFTPSVHTLDMRRMESFFRFPKGTLKAGGADEFLESLKSEIIPFVDKHYNTNSDRGISGESLGGLFTAYCFINSDGYFTRFGINFPRLEWNNDEVLDNGISKFKASDRWDIPATKVFVSSHEPLISVVGIERVSNVPTTLKFSASLENSNYENIALTQHIFIKDPNRSISSASASKILSALYGKE